jgi:hypothetical protein
MTKTSPKVFGGFADGLTVDAGDVRLPDAPGIGYELKGESTRCYMSWQRD